MYVCPLNLYFSASEGDGSFPEPAAETMLEFKLKVKCKHNFRAPKGSEDPKELYHHSNGKGSTHIQILMHIHKNNVPFPTLVMSGDMQWVPIGDQATQVS